MEDKTQSPQGIPVAVNPGDVWRVRAICDPVELVPHTPTLWIDGGIEEGIMTLFRADAYVGPNSHCPVCGVPMRADPDTFYAEYATDTGWLHGIVNAVCTADPAHDTGDATFPSMREYVALISESVRKAAIDCVLTLDMVDRGVDDVLYRTWNDPCVRLGCESVLSDDAIVLAHIKNGDCDPFSDALGVIAGNGDMITEQLLRDEVWEAILDQLLREDSHGIAVTKFEHVVGLRNTESATYNDWIDALGRPNADLKERLRAAPSYRYGYETRKFALCANCQHKWGEFATLDGVRRCRNCGEEFDPNQEDVWPKEIFSEREFEFKIILTPDSPTDDDEEDDDE